MSEQSAGDLIGLLALAVGALALAALLFWWTKKRAAKQDDQTQADGDHLSSRLAATFQPSDTEGIIGLPFVAFRDWPNAGGLVRNVASFADPVGGSISAFEYDWSRQSRDLFGNEIPQVGIGTYNPPDRYVSVGALARRPVELPPLFVSSFPDRGRQSFNHGPLTGSTPLAPVPEIPPGADVRQAFGIRFRTAGDPAWLAWLLTPTVMDGLLRGPPGVHVELGPNGVLAIAHPPLMRVVPLDAQIALAEWMRWFLALLPPLGQPAAEAPTAPSAPTA